MKTQTIAYVVIAVIIGIGVGYSLTPEYSESMKQRTSGMMELGVADKNLDLRYMNGMVSHHLAAIDLCKQALTATKREELKTLCTTIISADTKGIEGLNTWRSTWYRSTTPITIFTKTNLGTYDEQFDLRFLNAMITHHTEAISIAREVMGKSTRKEILTLADGVISGLGANKEQLIAWRKEWHNIE
jgi:uncharacterized protein (DUF305 family)